MTGWRVGYAVGDPEIIAAMSKTGTGQQLQPDGRIAVCD